MIQELLGQEPPKYLFTCPGCGMQQIYYHPHAPRLCFNCFCKEALGWTPEPHRRRLP